MISLASAPVSRKRARPAAWRYHGAVPGRGRAQRYIVGCRVEFDRPSGPVVAETEDVSPRGLFIRTDSLLPIGELTRLRLTLPDERKLSFSGRVIHIRLPQAARALARAAGMGLELRGDSLAFRELERFLVAVRSATAAAELEISSLALVVEPSAELRARLVHCLSGAGFRVSAFESAVEAVAACAAWCPDVVVAAAQMAPMNGAELAQAMSEHAVLSGVPLVLLGGDGSDMLRLEAYRAGAADFVPAPFLDEELIIRISRVAVPGATPALRGNLADVGIGTLLSLFEFERKSGVLLLLREGEALRVFLREGSIHRVEGGDDRSSSTARVLRLFDWHAGRFELTCCQVDVPNEVGASTSSLLLEHARRRDESAQAELAHSRASSR